MLNYLSEYRHKYVRDLVWLIGSSSFLSGSKDLLFPDQKWFENELERHREMLLELDREPVVPFFDTAILGKYFEQLFALWMTHSPHYSLICHNRQIEGPDGTLSEIDFIVRDSTGSYLHFETAVKYYLATGNGGYYENWIGPNARDNLAKKLSTVTQRQIPAVHSEYARPILEETGVSGLISKLFIKGNLLTPYGMDALDVPDDLVVTPNCYWLHYRDLDRIDRQQYWCIAPKTHWMGPVFLSPGELPIRRWPEIKRLLAAHHQTNGTALMIAALQKIHGLFIEQFRVMVVPDNWPEH